MSQQTEALKLALEDVYETIIKWDEGGGKRSRRELARRIVALADQPAQQQEPVAWMDEFGNTFPLGAQRGPKYLNEPMKPLYTSPPASKPWVGLTSEEVYACDQESGLPQHEITTGDLQAFAQCIEAKLKEKNA